jgi:hypothetical protein
LATALWAQTGSISGVVVGTADTPEANFELEIENSSTGEVFQATTRDDGSFQFAGLPPGDYVLLTDVGQRDEIRFSTTAGQQPVRVRIVSAVGGGTTPDVSTEVESISRSPEHVAEIFPQGEVDESVQADFINPSGDLYGGYNLTLLTEGLRPPLEFSPFVGPGVGGRDEQSNDFTVGGVDNNNRATPGPLLYLPDAATQEVTILQNPTAPTPSHVTGGHINAIITGGANDVHGSAYWYLQNRELNARDPRLDIFELEDNPRFDQNRFGGAVTAPIVKNKLFATANLEYIPFGFTAFPNGRTLAPTASSIQALRNDPRISQQNLDLLEDNVNLIRGFGDPIVVDGVPVSTGLADTAIDGHRNTWAGVGGLDFVAAHRHRLSARYMQNEIEASSSGGALPAFNTPNDTQSILASLGYTMTGTSFVNELRLGYNRLDSSFNPGTFAFAGEAEGSLPFVSIQGLDLNLGARYPYTDAKFNTYQISDNFTWTWGRHDFSFGGDARKTISSQLGFPQFNGVYTYSSLDRFLLDQTPDVMAQRAFGDPTLNANQWIVNGWVQDKMRLGSKVNLEAGLRYQWAELPEFARRQELNSGLDVDDLLTFDRPSTENWGFGPRVGIAYAPFSKLVVRAGGGVEYDTLYMASSMSRLLGPQSQLVTMSDPMSTTRGFLDAGGIERPADERAALGTFIGDQELPYTIHWNGGVQGSFFTNMTASVRYVGNRSVHQPRFGTLNANGFVNAERNLPVYFDSPAQSQLDDLSLTLNDIRDVQASDFVIEGFTNPVYGLQPIGTSWYHAAIAEINRRMTRGFQLGARYTLSDLQIDGYGNGLDLGITPDGHFNAPFNPDHRLTASAVFDLDDIVRTKGVLAGVLANFSVMGTYTYMSDIQAPLTNALDTSLSGAAAGVFQNPNGTVGVGSGVTPLRNTAGQIVAYRATNPNAQFVQGGFGSFSTGQSFFDFEQAHNFDVAAAKKFTIAERVTLEARGEAYNVFNNRQITGVGLHGFLSPNLLMMSTPSQLIPGSGNFGNLGSLFSSNPRRLQLGLRATF